MKVLITGGAGTIGRGLAEELRGRGHSVFTVDRHHGPDEMGFSLRTDVAKPTYARCDVGEYRQLERIFDKAGPFDLVYHAAAEFGRWNGEDFYEGLWQTNVVGTKNMIRLQERFGFKLVHFSSSEVYGDWPELMAESVMDDNEVKQLNDYAMTKWVNEMQVKNSSTQYKTQSVIIRIFNTYGPGEHYSPYRSVNCRFMYCALAGIPWLVFRGYGRTSTFLADSVRTIANISDNFKAGETYNIGGDQYHSIEELSELIVQVTGADPKLQQFKDAEMLTTRVKKVDISKAVRDLDHKTTVSLRQGIERTVDWMRKVYEFVPRKA